MNFLLGIILKFKKMKNSFFNPKNISKLLFVPAVAIIAISINACKKESGVGGAAPKATYSTSEKSSELKKSTAKALRDFVISGVASNQQSGAGAGSNNFSNTSLNVTTYSTPTATVYSWSDPTTGTSFTMSESSNSGGGLGQISYNGKSFDYNYVLCIKASNDDPTWDGFLNGRDLRGVIAIDGEIQGDDFSLKNLAIFLVDAKAGNGKYNFIDWDSQTFKTGEAIGELLDFSDVTNNSLAGLDMAKILVTSNGSIEVSDNEFVLSSNAKVRDVLTLTEYSVSGSISCE